MKCPYCGEEMKKGAILTSINHTPYWKEEGRKISLFDKANILPIRSDKLRIAIDGYNCGICGKIIIDTDTIT